MPKHGSSGIPKPAGTPVRAYEDLRLLSKRANQAMVRLERLGINTPAYEAVQAKLEILGKKTSGSRGRRFSESGRATWQEYQMLKSVLTSFMSAKTHSEKGAKQWVKSVWEGAESNPDLKLKEAGITREQWLEFWKAMPANHKDRIFGSDVIVELMRTYTVKNQRKKDDQKMSMSEIAQEIQNATDEKAAMKALGITSRYRSTVRKRLSEMKIPAAKKRTTAKRSSGNRKGSSKGAKKK